MSNRLWKLKYALRMQDKSWCEWSFAYDCAITALEELDEFDAQDMTPEDAADSEMSYWEE